MRKDSRPKRWLVGLALSVATLAGLGATGAAWADNDRSGRPGRTERHGGGQDWRGGGQDWRGGGRDWRGGHDRHGDHGRHGWHGWHNPGYHWRPDWRHGHYGHRHHGGYWTPPRWVWDGWGWVAEPGHWR